jgi:hypothetical protein
MFLSNEWHGLSFSRKSKGDKPVMGYLYEAMDRAEEAICAYYDDKGDDGFEKLLDFLAWEVLRMFCLACGCYLNIYTTRHLTL